MKTIEQLRTAIETAPARSAWSKAVKLYALELLEDLPSRPRHPILCNAHYTSCYNANNLAQYNAYYNTYLHLCYTALHYRSLINDGVDNQRKYFTKKAEQLEKEVEVIRLMLIEYEEREPEY